MAIRSWDRGALVAIVALVASSLVTATPAEGSGGRDLLVAGFMKDAVLRYDGGTGAFVGVSVISFAR